MSFAGTVIDGAKKLRQNRAARNSQRREKDKFGTYLGDSNIELNYNTEPLSEERKSEIHKRIKKQQRRSLAIGLIISIILLSLVLYLAFSNWSWLFG